MSINQKQTVSDVGIIIIDDIERQIEHIANLDSTADIKKQIPELQELLESSKSILKLIERVNENNRDTQNER